MIVTKKAKNYIQEQSKNLNNPCIVLFQQIYRGWCGTEVVTRVATADQSQVHNDIRFIMKQSEDCNYPIYVEEPLEKYWNMTKIDVAGWSAFKRLVLIVR